MTMFAICLFVLFMTTNTVVSAQDRLNGDWRGYWTQAGDTMAVTMHIKPGPQAGHFAATFDADRLRISGIPFDTARVEGCCNVTMVLRGDRTTMKFAGTVRADSLSGTFREGEARGAFAFMRTPAAAPGVLEQELVFANGPVKLAG